MNSIFRRRKCCLRHHICIFCSLTCLLNVVSRQGIISSTYIYIKKECLMWAYLITRTVSSYAAHQDTKTCQVIPSYTSAQYKTCLKLCATTTFPNHLSLFEKKPLDKGALYYNNLPEQLKKKSCNLSKVG